MANLNSVGDMINVVKRFGPKSHFSDEQIQELLPYITEEKKASVENLEDFCKKTGFTYQKVYSKISGERRKIEKEKSSPKPYKRKVGSLKTDKKKDVIFGSNSGEFEIPIRKWKLVQKSSGEMVLKISL